MSIWDGKIAYITSYPDPETFASVDDIYIQSSLKNLEKDIRAVMEMKPDRIVIDYESILNSDGGR